MTFFDFEKFFYSTPIPSCVIQDGYFKLVNKGFIGTTGYTELELLENSAASLVHPEDIASVLMDTVNCLSGKDMPGSFEFRVFSREGETVFARSHFTRVELNGHPAVLVQFIGARIKDMTERRKALNELFNSERKYRQLVELAWEGIWAIDDEAVTTFVNPRMAEILGYTTDEMTGRSLFSFMDEQGIESCSDYIERRRRGIREQHDFEFLHKDGRRVYTSLEAAPLFDDAGLYTGALAVVSDITGRKQAEQALARELTVSAALADLSRELLLTDSFDEISKLVLDQAKRLTDSRFGYVGYIDIQTGHILFPTLTKEIWDTCQVDDKTFVFEKFSGLWGWVLNERKPLLSNSPVGDPRCLGTPPGHIPINRFLSVPAMVGEKLVGQVALANSSRDYSDMDLEIVRRLSSLYAIAIQRKWTEENLKQSEEKHRILFETMAQGVVFQNGAGEITSASPAAERILGASYELMKAHSSKGPLWRTVREDGSDFPAEEHPSMVAFKTGKEVRNVVMGVPCPESGDCRWIKVISAVPQFRPGEEKPYRVYVIFDDITELKAAEEKFQDAHQQLLDIIESLPDATFVIDSDKKVIAWNQGMVEMTGVPKEEIIGRGDYAYAVPFYGEAKPIMIDLFFEEDRAAQDQYSFVKREGDSLYTETFVPKVYGGKGAYLWGKMSGIYNKDGELIGAIESIHDITERKEAEADLNNERRKFEILAREAPFGMVLIDRDGSFVYINPKFIELFGYDQAEISNGRQWFQKAYPDPTYRQEVISSWVNDLKDSRHGEKRPRTYTVTCRDGTKRIVNFVPVELETGEQLMTCEDITVRVQAENELKEQALFLQRLIDNIPNPIFYKDVQGLYQGCNRAFLTSLGLTKDNMIGKTAYDLSPKELAEEYHEMDTALFAEPGVQVYETSMLYADGTRRDVIFNKATYANPDGTLAGLVGVIIDITERKKAEEKIRQSEALRRSIIESPQNIISFSLDQNYQYISFNKAHYETIKNIWGAEIELGQSMLKYIAYPEDREKARICFDRALSGAHFSQIEEYGDEELGRKIWEDTYSPIVTETGEIIGLTVFCSDISERMLAQEKLRAANQQLLDIIDFLPDATFVIDRGGIVIAWNRAMEEMSGLRKEDILGKGDYAYAVPFYGEPRPLLIDLVFAEDRDTEQKYEFTDRRGATIYAEVYIQGLYGGEGGYLWGKASPLLDSDGNVAGAIESIRDITIRKNAEEQLKYLSLHDYLTGLYNRTFFEEGVQRASDGRFDPIGIIVCDVDGLKFVNDTLGHNAGDAILVAAANVIGSVFRKGDIVARIGGDEYAVLLTHSNEKTVEEACGRIKEAIEKYNLAGPEIPLNISIGFAVGSKETTNVSDLFKEADNNMYREKLHRSQSARSAIVKTLMKALEARDFITEGHALRLQDYVTGLARTIGLPMRNTSDLNLLAKFHDIGKVGVRDSILFKPGALTTEEAVEMQRHTEIGHRIAQSAPDLAPIADWILKHHEWWNGRGYPLGIKGEDIPLECRILAIADAYDAMTSDRPYRKAMTHETALDELKKYAGIQFDPELVRNFIWFSENHR